MKKGWEKEESINRLSKVFVSAEDYMIVKHLTYYQSEVSSRKRNGEITITALHKFGFA
jgi:hypothetical protein